MDGSVVFSAGERAAGAVGLVIAAVIGLVCLDLVTGGRLSGWLAAAGGTKPAEADDGGCGCG